MSLMNALAHKAELEVQYNCEFRLCYDNYLLGANGLLVKVLGRTKCSAYQNNPDSHLLVYVRIPGKQGLQRRYLYHLMVEVFFDKFNQAWLDNSIIVTSKHRYKTIKHKWRVVFRDGDKRNVALSNLQLKANNAHYREIVYAQNKPKRTYIKNYEKEPNYDFNKDPNDPKVIAKREYWREYKRNQRTKFNLKDTLTPEV
jgi:hypothetical protein